MHPGPPPPRPALRDRVAHSVPAQLRCSACGGAFALPSTRLPIASAGHELRAVQIVAGGTCRGCARSARRAARAKREPLAHASSRSLRLLVGHLLLTRPRALERAGLLAPGGDRPVCVALFQGLAAVLGTAAGRRTLDAVLGRELGPEARPFDALALPALAERLPHEAARASRRTLHALLWSVARRPGVAYRKLEPRIADPIEAHRALEDAWPSLPSRRHARARRGDAPGCPDLADARRGR